MGVCVDVYNWPTLAVETVFKQLEKLCYAMKFNNKVKEYSTSPRVIGFYLWVLKPLYSLARGCTVL